MAAVAAYEAQRQRQVEENKRRIEELGLRHLAAAAMPPQAKKLKHKARVPGAAAASMTTQPRRSSRVANLSEQPDYRESLRPKKNIGVGPTAMERSYAIAKAKAEELEGELGADYPTFVKTMTQYYAATASWLALPSQFCRQHLPEHDEVITLVDEEEEEFGMQYQCCKWRIDGHYQITWKRFAISHKLDDGDCLVFQLIQQRKFKVYIIRARSYLKMMTVKTENF